MRFGPLTLTDQRKSKKEFLDENTKNLVFFVFMDFENDDIPPTFPLYKFRGKLTTILK